MELALLLGGISNPWGMAVVGKRLLSLSPHRGLVTPGCDWSFNSSIQRTRSKDGRFNEPRVSRPNLK
jgi:hypothetical protein